SREYVLKVFLEHTQVAHPRSVSTQIIQRWHDKIAETNGHTAEAYVKQVRWWLDWLIEEGRLVRNVAKDVKMPELPPRQRRLFMVAS
ncbi:hypothetical protein, partial [Pseudomonas poae]|uniref:hypothetical protein n=1 Tax=Pseudomonas poae TaxID=200451 RepID=UPI0034D6174D